MLCQITGSYWSTKVLHCRTTCKNQMWVLISQVKGLKLGPDFYLHPCIYLLLTCIIHLGFMNRRLSRLGIVKVILGRVVWQGRPVGIQKKNCHWTLYGDFHNKTPTIDAYGPAISSQASSAKVMTSVWRENKTWYQTWLRTFILDLRIKLKA